MTHRYRDIFLLYTREKTLSALVVIFFAGVFLTFIPAIAPKILASLAIRSALGSVLIMVGLWMTFLLGILLKRQFANPRASLLPGYRLPHAEVFLVIYSGLVLIGILWTLYLAKQFNAPFDDKLAVIAPGIFVSIVSVTLGYLSVGPLVAGTFITFCLFSDPIYNFSGERIGFIPTNFLTIFLSGIVLIVLAQRFLVVKEEHWEYPHLFSWSRKSFRVRNNFVAVFDCLRKISGLRAPLVPRAAYHTRVGILSRTLHWEHSKFEYYRAITMLLVLLTPLYFFYIHLVPRHFVSFLDGHLKYFLLAVYPVVLAVGLNQRSIAQWGYDLTKPVRREKFIQEKGAAILIDIALYWFAAVVFVMVLPYWILEPVRLMDARFWVEIIFTLAYNLAAFGWIACMRNLSSGWMVISLLALTFLTCIQLFSLSLLPVDVILIDGLTCVVAGFFLIRLAYQKWRCAELR